MTIVSASASQVTIVASNSSRKALIVANVSASTLYLSTVNGFSKTASPFVIPPNAEWTLPAAYTGIVYGVWDVATGQAVVQEA